MGAPWYVAAFRAGYLEVYAHRDEAAAASEVRFAAATLDVGRGPLLDAGCGAGRHARALAARGVVVTGMDLSAALLCVAGERGGGPAYVQGDLRALPFRDAGFAAVTSFFTAFGYFDEAGDRRQLEEFRRVLRTGGGLLLDFLNSDRVRDTLVPRSERTQGGAHVCEERAIRGNRVEKSVTVTRADGAVFGWRESVRLYGVDELRRLLVAAGFAVRSVHGDLHGAPFAAATSPRCVVIGDAR